MDNYDALTIDDALIEKEAVHQKSFFATTYGAKCLARFTWWSIANVVTSIVCVLLINFMLIGVGMLLSDFIDGQNLEVLFLLFSWVPLIIWGIVELVCYISTLEDMAGANKYFADAYKTKKKQTIVGVGGNIAGSILENSNSVALNIIGAAIDAGSSAYTAIKQLDFYTALNYGFNLELENVFNKELIEEGNRVFQHRKKMHIWVLVASLILTVGFVAGVYMFVDEFENISTIIYAFTAFIDVMCLLVFIPDIKLCRYFKKVSNFFNRLAN